MFKVWPSPLLPLMVAVTTTSWSLATKLRMQRSFEADSWPRCAWISNFKAETSGSRNARQSLRAKSNAMAAIASDAKRIEGKNRWKSEQWNSRKAEGGSRSNWRRGKSRGRTGEVATGPCHIKGHACQEIMSVHLNPSSSSSSSSSASSSSSDTPHLRISSSSICSSTPSAAKPVCKRNVKWAYNGAVVDHKPCGHFRALNSTNARESRTNVSSKLDISKTHSFIPSIR